MDDKDARRIVLARSMMWDDASSDEQAKWLRTADDARAILKLATSRPPVEVADEEGGKPTQPVKADLRGSDGPCRCRHARSLHSTGPCGITGCGCIWWGAP